MEKPTEKDTGTTTPDAKELEKAQAALDRIDAESKEVAAKLDEKEKEEKARLDVEREKLFAAQAEADRLRRLEAEQAEAERARVAAEQAEAERARVAAEQAEAERARVAAEQAEAERARIAAEHAEAERTRIAAEQAEAERTRIAAEQTKAEPAPLGAEQTEAEPAPLSAEQTEATPVITPGIVQRALAAAEKILRIKQDQSTEQKTRVEEKQAPGTPADEQLESVQETKTEQASEIPAINSQPEEEVVVNPLQQEKEGYLAAAKAYKAYSNRWQCRLSLIHFHHAAGRTRSDEFCEAIQAAPDSDAVNAIVDAYINGTHGGNLHPSSLRTYIAVAKDGDNTDYATLSQKSAALQNARLQPAPTVSLEVLS